jgi:transposase InsO family protein
MNRLASMCRVNQTREFRRRGLAGQSARRRLERTVRQEVVAFRRWTAGRGMTRPRAAALVGVRPRTLRRWEADAARDLELRALGRPTARSPRPQRTEVLEIIQALGPAVGLPTLQALFADMARAELHDLLSRCRRLWIRRCRRAIHVLHWHQPGAVWAMDYAEPPQPIDGRYPYLFAVRDLASGQQLLWLPVEEPTAQVTQEALTMLMTCQGPPLVLKSDNGAPFVAAETRALLQTWGVLPLYSPPRLPRYNGSCEAGIGSLKTRTYHRAVRHVRSDVWTADDVEAARLEVNTTLRPWGAAGPTPQEAWNGRTLIAHEERERFIQAVVNARTEERTRQNLAMVGPWPHREEAPVDRVAIRRTLVAFGLLSFTRRQIPLPLFLKKVSNIM